MPTDSSLGLLSPLSPETSVAHRQLKSEIRLVETQPHSVDPAPRIVCPLDNDCDDRNVNGDYEIGRGTKVHRSNAGAELFSEHSDTQAIYCGDNLDKLRTMPRSRVQRSYELSNNCCDIEPCRARR